MWAAMRYRRVQALVIVALSALITACAVFAPLYERAVEQALVVARLSELPSVDRAITVSSVQVAPGGEGVDQLSALVPDRLRAVTGPVVPMSSVRVVLLAVPGAGTTLRHRAGMCEHVSFDAGACPQARDEVAVSSAAARLWKWRVGQQVTVQQAHLPVMTGAPEPRPLQITGTYTQPHDDPYWLGAVLDRRTSAATLTESEKSLDEWLTPASTFGPGAWTTPDTTIDLSLRPGAVDVDNLPDVAADVARLRAAAIATGPVVEVHSPLPETAARVQLDQAQAQIIVPLLMAQLVVLMVVVLRLVLAAAIEQRRPEVALARLRGQGARGARRLLLSELGTLVLVGLPAGCTLAVGMTVLARHLWLPAGVPFELPRWILPAVAIAALLALGTVWLAARGAVRDQIVSLLRRVPERRAGWRLGVADAVVVAVAAAAVLALTSGNRTGALALLTPTLIALAAGLLLAHALVPAAAVVGERLVRKGRLRPGLLSLQIARRPAVRRVITIITVSTALIVFAGNAFLIGAHNRQTLAQAEVGAPMVVTVDDRDAAGTGLRGVDQALHRLDPAGTTLTPVVQIRSGGPAGLETQAVRPEEFAHIAFVGPASKGYDWSRLAPPATAPLKITAEQVSITAATTELLTRYSSASGATLWTTPAAIRAQLKAAGESELLARIKPQVRPILGLEVVDADGERVQVQLGRVPAVEAPSVTLTTDIPCAKGCSVTGLSLESPSATFAPIKGSLQLSAFTAGARAVAGLDAPDAWRSTPAAPGDELSVSPVAGQPGSVHVTFVDTAALQVSADHASVPSALPALVGSSVTEVESTLSAPGLTAVDRLMVPAGTVPWVPGADPRSVLVNLDTLAREGSRTDGAATIEIWSGKADAATLADITAGLRVQDLGVTGVERSSDRLRGYDASASAWGLQLSIVVGLAALLIAGLVMIVVMATSWRERSRDYAALRMSGVRRRAIAWAAVGEQFVVVVLAVLAGAVCGVAGVHLAMPILPLFAEPPDLPVIDLSTVWSAAGGTLLGVLVLLGALGIVLGVGLAKRAVLSRLGEPL